MDSRSILVCEPDAHAESDDAFLRFVDFARSMVSSGENGESDGGKDEESPQGPSWRWIASRILKTCTAYPSGVTSAILLSELFQASSPSIVTTAWSEQHRSGSSKRLTEFIVQLKKKHRRTKLPNTVTIDSVLEKNFLSMNSVLEAVVLNAYLLLGTNIYMLTLGDFWSTSTIDLYLHRRYYDMVNPDYGILKKGREIFLTGCSLRTAKEGCGQPRLLPTEYLVVLLNEDDDEDAMLLGAHFCSDSFSSISFDAVKDGTSYSFYARIESIGLLETHGKFGCLQRKQITLVDNDGVKLKFFLWGEQVLLANLCSVGSMLALDRPFIANSVDSGHTMNDEICLEYGSATQLYLVPFVHHEEQSFIVDLHDKMIGISLYGAVTSISRDSNTEGTSLLENGDYSTNLPLFLACSLRIQIIWKKSRLEVSWFEKDNGAFVNLSSLPALLNSPCLHKLSCLSDLSSQSNVMHVTFADETGKFFAWCTGQTAAELLQISPDEFYELPEDEQAMYLYTLENERFIVAIVNNKRRRHGPCVFDLESDTPTWEIARALKCE
ncbi:hypothetical protein ACLOJK_026500 [Asimina triloba]